MYDFENKNPLWHVHEDLVPKNGQIIVDGKLVQTWPDNDGGLWYYDQDGKKVIIK